MTHNAEQYFARYLAYVGPRHAAAHGTVCGACFNDVCIHCIGFVKFLFELGNFADRQFADRHFIDRHFIDNSEILPRTQFTDTQFADRDNSDRDYTVVRHRRELHCKMFLAFHIIVQ